MINVFGNKQFHKFYAAAGSATGGALYTIGADGTLEVSATVTELTAEVFHGLTPDQISGVKVVSLPKSLTKIEPDALASFTNVYKYKMSVNANFVVDGTGSILTKNKKTLIRVPNMRTTTGSSFVLNYTVPVGVEQISENAFSNSNYKKVILPNTIIEDGITLESLLNSQVEELAFPKFKPIDKSTVQKITVSLFNKKDAEKEEARTSKAISDIAEILVSSKAPVGYANAVKIQSKLTGITTHELLEIIEKTKGVKLVSVEEYDKGKVSGAVTTKDGFKQLKSNLEKYQALLIERSKKIERDVATYKLAIESHKLKKEADYQAKVLRLEAKIEALEGSKKKATALIKNVSITLGNVSSIIESGFVPQTVVDWYESVGSKSKDNLTVNLKDVLNNARANNGSIEFILGSNLAEEIVYINKAFKGVTPAKNGPVPPTNDTKVKSTSKASKVSDVLEVIENLKNIVLSNDEKTTTRFASVDSSIERITESLVSLEKFEKERTVEKDIQTLNSTVSGIISRLDDGSIVNAEEIINPILSELAELKSSVATVEEKSTNLQPVLDEIESLGKKVEDKSFKVDLSEVYKELSDIKEQVKEKPEVDFAEVLEEVSSIKQTVSSGMEDVYNKIDEMKDSLNTTNKNDAQKLQETIGGMESTLAQLTEKLDNLEVEQPVNEDAVTKDDLAALQNEMNRQIEENSEKLAKDIAEQFKGIVDNLPKNNEDKVNEFAEKLKNISENIEALDETVRNIKTTTPEDIKTAVNASVEESAQQFELVIDGLKTSISGMESQLTELKENPKEVDFTPIENELDAMLGLMSEQATSYRVATESVTSKIDNTDQKLNKVEKQIEEVTTAVETAKTLISSVPTEEAVVKIAQDAAKQASIKGTKILERKMSERFNNQEDKIEDKLDSLRTEIKTDVNSAFEMAQTNTLQIMAAILLAQGNGKGTRTIEIPGMPEPIEIPSSGIEKDEVLKIVEDTVTNAFDKVEEQRRLDAEEAEKSRKADRKDAEVSLEGFAKIMAESFKTMQETIAENNRIQQQIIDERLQKMEEIIGRNMGPTTRIVPEPPVTPVMPDPVTTAAPDPVTAAELDPVAETAEDPTTPITPVAPEPVTATAVPDSVTPVAPVTPDPAATPITPVAPDPVTTAAPDPATLVAPDASTPEDPEIGKYRPSLWRRITGFIGRHWMALGFAGTIVGLIVSAFTLGIGTPLAALSWVAFNGVNALGIFGGVFAIKQLFFRNQRRKSELKAKILKQQRKINAKIKGKRVLFVRRKGIDELLNVNKQLYAAIKMSPKNKRNVKKYIKKLKKNDELISLRLNEIGNIADKKMASAIDKYKSYAIKTGKEDKFLADLEKAKKYNLYEFKRYRGGAISDVEERRELFVNNGINYFKQRRGLRYLFSSSNKHLSFDYMNDYENELQGLYTQDEVMYESTKDAGSRKLFNSVETYKKYKAQIDARKAELDAERKKIYEETKRLLPPGSGITDIRNEEELKMAIKAINAGNDAIRQTGLVEVFHKIKENDAKVADLEKTSSNISPLKPTKAHKKELDAFIKKR